MRHDHVNITMLVWIILTANMGMDETSTQAVFSTPNLLLFHCKNGLVPGIKYNKQYIVKILFIRPWGVYMKQNVKQFSACR